MKTCATLSPYKVFWVDFRTVSGTVSKSDYKKINGHTLSFLPGRRSEQKCVGTKEKAAEFIENMKKVSLSQKYECRIFSDKQFSMATADIKRGDIIIPFTKKQNAEMVVIGL